MATTETTVRDALGLCCLEKRRQVLLRGDRLTAHQQGPETDVLLDCRKQDWGMGGTMGARLQLSVRRDRRTEGLGTVSLSSLEGHPSLEDGEAGHPSRSCTEDAGRCWGIMGVLGMRDVEGCWGMLRDARGC